MILLFGVFLAGLMGATLGLLGGGGSILTVPILVYVLGVGAKPAIATSLLVVGATSLAGVVQHARAGNVRWKVGLLFGSVAMIGAYGGSQVAAYLSGSILLGLFTMMMLVTAAAMLRGNRQNQAHGSRRERGARWAVEIAGKGLLVGAFTGLVGAGGGFLIVPALVLLGGLDMRAAVGTSLLVIAMNSCAGLAGYLTHVDIDLHLAAALTAAAVGGSLIGALAANRIPAALLRTAFAWFVLAMGFAMLLGHLPSALRWPLAGVALVGLCASVLLVLNGKIARIGTAEGGSLRAK